MAPQPSRSPKDLPPDVLAYLRGLARLLAWILVITAYLFLLARVAHHFSSKADGIVCLGLAGLLFVLAAARPLGVRWLKYHPFFWLIGDLGDDAPVGEAYLILIGVGFVLYGVYALFT